MSAATAKTTSATPNVACSSGVPPNGMPDRESAFADASQIALGRQPRARSDDVHSAARGAEPLSLELPARVRTTDHRVARRGRIVHDRIARLVEADDDAEVSLDRGERRAVELARGPRVRRDHRD